MQSDPSQPCAPARIEVCDKHGLRYNAATDDGCTRCRTETGTRTMAPKPMSVSHRPDSRRSLLVAGLLVIVVGFALFAVHTVAYRLGSAVIERTWEEMDAEATERLEDESSFD